MGIESLEGRWLLSGTPAGGKGAQFEPAEYGQIVAVESGTTLEFTNVHSVQIVDEGGGTIVIYDKSLPGSDPAYAQTYTGITDLIVTGTRGGDIISGSLFSVNTVINAGGGHDTLPVSVYPNGDADPGTANVVVNGGAGNDLFSGNNAGTGDFVFNGGPGKDAFGAIGDPGSGIVFNQ